MADQFSRLGALAPGERPGQDIEMGDRVSGRPQPSSPRSPYPGVDFTPVIGDDLSDVDLGMSP